MKGCDGLSLFAEDSPLPDSLAYRRLQSMPQSQSVRSLVNGLLALSPIAFRDSGDLISCPTQDDAQKVFDMSNKGLHIELPVAKIQARPVAPETSSVYFSLLSC